jgi:hypothetical protein
MERLVGMECVQHPLVKGPLGSVDLMLGVDAYLSQCPDTLYCVLAWN